MKKIFPVIFLAIFYIAAIVHYSDKNTQTVSAEGSSSMEKLIRILGESFEANNSDISFTFNPSGSDSGIQAVMEGRCDIGLSSRNLNDTEITGGLQSVILGYDGIAVIINPQNPLRNVDIDTLSQIFTGKINNWKELGGADAEIVLIGRQTGSGTRDAFETAAKTINACKYRQEFTASGDVMAAVAQNPFAIGYVSLASVRDTVRVLSINGTEPSTATVKNGSYAIQRPFLLVTKGKLSKTAQEFFDFAVSKKAVSFISYIGAVPAVF